MKFTKMSLVAALLVGSSAFALDNVKISGDAQLFYSTDDATGGSMFQDKNSAGDTAIHLGATADLAKGVSAGASMTAVSSLGLENNLVNKVWASAHSLQTGNTTPNPSSFGASVNTASWFNEAWVAGTLGKTTVKLGRMELDTPLAFTEKWSIERNTFDAAVAINQDLPDTTIVAAYVGQGNGTEVFDQNNTGALSAAAGNAVGGVVNQDGTFQTYGTNGAYAFGVINNTYKPLVVQAWYYDVSKLVQAYWLQADVKVENLLFGAQYCVESLDNGTAKDDKILALMAGYVAKDLATIKVAYSATNKDGALGNLGLTVGGNTATSNGTAQSKLYTEAWWNYGVVTVQNTTALHASVEGSLKGIDLGLYATKTDDKTTASDRDMTEIAVTASKDFGPLNTTVAYINTDRKASGGATSTNLNTVQAYLTLSF